VTAVVGEALGGWLVKALAQGAFRGVGAVVLGKKEERGLRKALHGAVELIAARVGDEHREFFAAVLHDRLRRGD